MSKPTPKAILDKHVAEQLSIMEAMQDQYHSHRKSGNVYYSKAMEQYKEANRLKDEINKCRESFGLEPFEGVRKVMMKRKLDDPTPDAKKLTFSSDEDKDNK